MNEKQANDIWSELAQAFYANAVADNSPRGSLGERHTRRIAAQHAQKYLAMDNADRARKVVIICGVIALIAFAVTRFLVNL